LSFFFNIKIIIRTALDAHNNPNPTKRHRVTVVSRPVVVCNKSRKSSVISITPSYGFFLSLTNNEICFLFPSSRDGFSDNRNHPLCFFPLLAHHFVGFQANYYKKISLCFVSSPVKMIGDIVCARKMNGKTLFRFLPFHFQIGVEFCTCSFRRTKKSPSKKIVDSNCGRCGGGWNLLKTFLPFIMEVWKADKVIIISLVRRWLTLDKGGGEKTHPENLTQSKKRVLNF
jgi:hypothetical protein